MKLKLFRHLWGVNQSWEIAFPKFAAFGYVGIECPLPAAGERDRFNRLLNEHHFEYIAMAFTNGATPSEHAADFRRQIVEAKAAGAVQVTVHSGRDSWSAGEAEAFYSEAEKIEADAGIAVAHETHRGRYFFNPWNTRHILDRLPRLSLCCDYSHWVCVAERLLDDCEDILKLAGNRCIHLHARVGYEEGPQVPDPSAPEYARHLEAHEKWWDWIWQSQRDRRQSFTTLTPEFGPPHYLHTLPHTNVPVADLWSVCDWQSKRQMVRFATKGFAG